MGKHSEQKTKDGNDGDTKILFKKSYSNFSRSRTISGVSQLYSRSGIMQIKKNSGTNHHRYYTDRGKIKRDFSVETDICILRRYYRKKKSLLGENSAKSRYSTLVDTECETIEEYPDTSGCGDNDNDTEKSNQPLDVASLMIDNLKDLLNQWIQTHLIQNKDTKQKIDTVLDSLIRKLETRNNLASSSGSTYILHKEAGKQEVKNKKIATASLTCQCCKHHPRYVNVESSPVSTVSQKRSSEGITEPFNYKDIRIISTLSIPRSFHRRGLEEKTEQSSWYRMKKIKHRNLFLSIDQSTKLIHSSSFDLVAISTKSLTKKTTNNDTISKKKKRHIVFFPKPFYKSATETSSATNDENLQIKNVHVEKDRFSTMPSLMESLYANDPIMPEKNIKYACGTHNSNKTMTENNYVSEVGVSKSKVATEIKKDIYARQAKQRYLTSKNKSTSVVGIDSVDTKIETPKKSGLVLPENSKTKTIRKKATNKGKVNKLKQRSAFQTLNNKQFTFLYKKAQSQTSPGGEFLKHCKNIMQFFEEYKNNNIKLDVQINVYPTCQSNKKDVYTDVSYQSLGVYDIKFNPTVLNNIETKLDAKVHMDEEPVKHNIENENRLKEQHPLASYSKTRLPEIIPLLDSSVCQTKFIFDVNSQEKVQALSKTNLVESSYVEQSTLTTELEIVQEISELRAVIRDLAAAAERFVNEQLKRESNKLNDETVVSRNPSNYTSSSKVEAIVSLRNPSKAIQYSKETFGKEKLLSGLKITKEPKKKETFEFYNKLAKKSTSYRIIESESILRVTDMTSGANDLNEPPDTSDSNDTRAAKKASQDSTQKSKSLFEFSSEQANKQKMVSLFHDGYRKSLQCRVCSVHRNRPLSSSSDKSCKQLLKLFGWGTTKRPETCQQSATTPILPPCICKSGTNFTDSLPAMCLEPTRIPEPVSFSSIEGLCPGEEEKVAMNYSCEDEQTATMNNCSSEEDQIRTCQSVCVKERRGMGFGEGCVYCVLMWIPIFLLSCLFYAYVLKDRIKFLNTDVRPRLNNTQNQSSIRPSDLGF